MCQGGCKAAAAVADYDARFVTWNVARALESKTSALEQLIKLAERPTFIALQECGNCDLAGNSTAAASIRDLGYAAFQAFRDGDRSNVHGGAALLVRHDQGLLVRPHRWAAAEEWRHAPAGGGPPVSQCETVSVVVTLPTDGSEFIVTSLYVHGSSADAAGFARVIATLRDDQVLCGDLNAQLPGSKRGGSGIAELFKLRGEALLDVIQDLNAMYPTPTGPTRPVVSVDDETEMRTVDFTLGTINDHIVVGADVFRRVRAGEMESLVLTDRAWPSDHLPLVWSASLGLRTQPADHSWARTTDWRRVEPPHRVDYNRAFRNAMRRAAAVRDFAVLAIDEACLNAARATLPQARPRGARDGLFWTEAARRRVDEVVQRSGDGAHSEITKAHAAARRKVLADNAKLSPNPSSCWPFVKKFFAFGGGKQLRAPLIVPAAAGEEAQPPNLGDPAATRKVTAIEERVEVLAAAYASVSANPCGVDAQRQLEEVLARIPDAQATAHEWRKISVTELRVAVSSLNPGKCADFLGMRAEHLRILDDESLAAMLPIVDRTLRLGVVPPHWRSAAVSPVPKRGRDLSLVKSWRPVSVTAILCRMCEAVQQNRVSHVFETHRRGQSQFGFRRGVSTSMPLTGLSMFIRDGRRQQTRAPLWDATDPVSGAATVWGDRADEERAQRTHASLLVSIDGSDAFCRALPATAIARLLDMGLVAEARWIGEFLRGRTLVVRENGRASAARELARGVPQGSILGPLLWSLVVDELIEKCEQRCVAPLPGCVVVPIVFADDINFVVRGFNPSSMVAQANVMMGIVREWATENGVPMAKLQASWITGGAHAADWAKTWQREHPADGEIVFDDKVRCYPGVQPVKLLGVTFDTLGTFSDHVEQLVETCERHMKLLMGMAGLVKAEHLTVLYRGIILSRLLYAVDCWYPFVSVENAARLESLHYRACCAITGCVGRPDTSSVCYEAGFRSFEEEARSEIIRTADKLRRMHDGCESLAVSQQCYGVEWVVRLFRDGRMPTAALRPVRCSQGDRTREDAVWPKPGWSRAACPDVPARRRCGALRDLAFGMRHGAPHEKRRMDARVEHESLRDLPRAHPWAPHELRLFDSHVQFVVDAPRGLVKPKVMEVDEKRLAEQKRPFAEANAERIEQLVRQHGADAVFVYTDAARREEGNDDEVPECCAGAYVVCRGCDPNVRGSVLRKAQVAPSPIACTYTAELATIHDALLWVRDNEALLFGGGAPRRVVLVTDSKSALESMRTTWVRRIGQLEQETCRLLYDLACADVRVALAFVFSHMGGAPGNDYVDRVAVRACLSETGRRWDATTLWHVDTTRRILRDHNRAVDAQLAATSDAFRFTRAPKRMRGAPSTPLPRDMQRPDEKLLFRARVGMLVEAGGMRHGEQAECPLCGEKELGRGGATMEHVLQCVPRYTTPPLVIEPTTLWESPSAAVAQLKKVRAFVQFTPAGRARMEAFELRKEKKRPRGARR